MRILCFSRRREEQAYALLLTLVFTGIILITFGSMMHWSATNAKITKRNLLFTQSQSAAESAGEVALAAMMRDFTSQGYLNAASTYESLSMLQSNWPVEFEISDGSSNVNQVSVSVGSTNWVALPFQYAGLHGLGLSTEDRAVDRLPKSGYREFPQRTGAGLAHEYGNHGLSLIRTHRHDHKRRNSR